ncbi:MULE transposase domain-containing protein [Metarhizium brunneum]
MMPDIVSLFAYSIYKQSIDNYKALLTTAREYKTQGLAYSNAWKLLKEEATGLVIKRRDYYNLVRLCPQDVKDHDDTITALLRALEARAFKYRLRTEDTIKGRRSQARSDLLLLRAGSAFYPAIYLKFVAVGKTNTNRTMPVAFSYAPSEFTESFIFFFDYIRIEFYYNGVCEPAVVIVDHSSGIISAYNTHNALPQSQLQTCTWHVQTAIIRRFSDHQYTREDIDGDESKGVVGLRQLIKNYIYSYTLQDLETNGALLINSLQPEDLWYIADNWQRKEPRFIVAYTK